MKKSRFPLWAWILTGYLSMGRPFAYLGVPPLFISEAYLGWQILRNRHNWLGRFADDVVRLEPLSAAIALNLLWGLVEVFRCMYMARPPLEIVRTFALSYYPVYLLAGISIGQDWTAPQFVRVWKILLLVYCPYTVIQTVYQGAIFNVDLGVAQLCPMMPATILALWTYLRTWRLRNVLFLASLYPIIFVNGTGRAFYLALIAGLVMVVIASGMQIRRILTYAIASLAILTVIGPFVVVSGGRHPLDPLVFVTKIVASFDDTLAIKILETRGYREEADVIVAAVGTAKWRQQIWHGAIHSLDTTELVIMGQGGGASLAEFVPQHAEIHTPHNFVVFCLYYVGVVGLVLYLFLLTALFLKARSIQDSGIRAMLQGIIAATLLVALFSDCFETPYAAVPFYFLCGLLLGVGRAMPSNPMRAGARNLSDKQRLARGTAHVVRNPVFAPHSTA